MTSVEEKIKILKMIDNGKISAEEGAKLLSASSEGRRSSSASTTPRWLRIRITDINTGHDKASVQIPLTLVDAGMKIGARFIPDVEGVETTNVTDVIKSGIAGKIIDVVDDKGGEHFEIYIE